MGAAPLSAAVGCADSSKWQRIGMLEPKSNIFDVYEIGGLLGSGSFGQVRLCWPISEVDNNRKYAVKVVDTKGPVYAHASSFISARQEANILTSVRHPHIVELIDVFEKERWLFLVMECVSGGELFAALADPKVAVSEGCVAAVGRQLLQALRHLHEQSIVHRDVKAENILLLSNPAKTSKWHIKLIDFGLAMRMEQQPACFFRLCREQEVPIEELICGTAYYCAPEVWVNDYGPKVDVWAAGVVLYLALYGAFPYYTGDPSAIEALICDPDSHPSFQPVCKKDCPGYEVSPQARQCLVSLLEKDKENRPTAASALMQSWLQETKRSGSLALVPRPRPLGSSMAARANSVGCGGDFLAMADRPVPVAVRVKAGRAAARPPVEPDKEESRTAALEALKVRVALGSPRACKTASGSPSRSSRSPGNGNAPSFVWRSPRVQSRELEVEAAEGKIKGVPMLSWLEYDVADASLTDSDTDEGHVICTCR
mmetsp:Transcript_117782/g.328069  ORF Transcript_117782/g.328069 Transcript_117782/m.328069 type:complete len:484 (-) Transcript_117782:180-1631(-)